MQIKSRFQHYRVSQASTSPSSQDAFYVKFLDTWTVKLTTLDDQLAQIADYNFFFCISFSKNHKTSRKFTLRKHIPSSYPNITVLNKIHPLPPVFSLSSLIIEQSMENYRIFIRSKRQNTKLLFMFYFH